MQIICEFYNKTRTELEPAIFTRDSIMLVYAIARPSVCLSVSLSPSVYLSDGCIIEKRLKLGL